MSNNPDISIIVPIYNVEEYLEECLNSLKNQTKNNIEVIMVDDDSPDSSADIAKDFEQKYPNFHYYHKENNGLGCARNYGAKKAKGKYIAFMDSDDIVSLDLYEKMFACAEKNNSDLTICNVVRFNSKKAWRSSLHTRVFKNIDSNTHITKNPNLLSDTTSWNKLILRSFYEKHNFAFPENILYEDIPVAIPMHLLANNVSVVESSYYFWRVRDGATKSITQNTDNLVNLTDRIKIMQMLDDFFERNNVSSELSKLKQKKHLEIDLMIFINNIRLIPKELSIKVLEIINKYIDEAIDDDVFSMLPLIYQQKYIYARNYDVDSLISLLGYQGSDYYYAAVNEEDGRFIVQLPENLFTLKSRDITDELKQYPPKISLTDATFGKDKIELTGFIYHSRVAVSDFTQQKITAYLENEFTQELTKLDVTQITDKNITQLNGTVFDSATQITSNYNYDAAAFKIKIDLNKFDFNDSNYGYNRVVIFYENRLVKQKAWLSAYHKIAPNSAVLLGDKYIKVDYDEVNELRILVKKERIFAESLDASSENITVILNKNADSLYAVDENNCVIQFNKQGENKFILSPSALKRNEVYNILVKADDKERNLLFKSKRIIVRSEGKASVVFMTNKNHEARFTVKDSVTAVDSITQVGNRVNLKTTALADNSMPNPDKAILFVNDEISGERVVLAASNCRLENGKAFCSFTIDFNDDNVTKNLYSGMRDMLVSYEHKGEEISRNMIYSAKFYRCNVIFDTLELSCYRAINGNIRLKATQLWREEENTYQKRKALLAENYPKYLQEPIDPMVIMFESMWGGKYSCNPQYIYEYIDRNYPQYKCVWSFKEERTPIKGNGIRVRRDSQEYYHYLATAKYLFNNVNYPTAYIKREGQIEVQTMHGTPLKTLGLEVPGDFPTESSRNAYIEKNKRWNYLLVQGEFMKGKAYDCFNFDKEILEYGYPRTDILYNVTEDKITQLKKQLNIPLDKKVILYTPTWRKKGMFDMELNIKKMRQALADEYVLLVRLHHLCAPNAAVEADNEFVFDLHSYRSVEDLYLISDILITDYSSVMFDYALLNKPMIFFMYDLVDYRDNLRGMYVDIEQEAPGPIVFTTDEVISTIKNIESETEKCSKKITAFKEKFLSYENGESCKNIVDKVIQPQEYHQVKSKNSTLKSIFKKIFK